MVFQARRGQDASLDEAWLDAAGAVDRGKLQWALDSGNIKVVSSVLTRKHGPALASEPLEDGQLPLFVAIELLGRQCGPSPRTVVDLVTLLLEKRAEANVQFPPLNESALQIVLRMDALGNAQSEPAVRHWACMRAVVVLLEHKADPNHTDTQGEGPLAEAAVAGNLEACVLLLSHGASPTAPTRKKGQTILDLDMPVAARALLEGGEDPDAERWASCEDVDQNGLRTDMLFDDDAAAGLNSSLTANAVTNGTVLSELPVGPEEEIEEVNTAIAGVALDVSAGGQDAPVASSSAAGLTDEVLVLCEKADSHFRAKQYREANQTYSEALKQKPDNATLWSNKAAACMMLGEFQPAFTDSSEGIKKDSEHGRVHERCAKCMLLLGKLQEAVKFCQATSERKKSEEFNSTSGGWRAFIDTASRVRDHSDVISQIDAVLGDTRNSDDLANAEKSEKCVSSLLSMIGQLGGPLEARSAWGKRLALTKVKALLFPVAGKTGQKGEDRLLWGRQGLDEVERLISFDPRDPELHHWKGRALLRISLRPQARESFVQAVRLGGGKHKASQELLECLDISETEKEQGKQAFLQADYKAAQLHYDIAIRADRLHPDPAFSGTLFCNRSTCAHKRGGQVSLCSALEDVNKALFFRQAYTKAFIRRGLICMDQERYESARSSFYDAAKLEPDFVGLAELQGRARRWTAKPPRRNYYAVLRVGFDASEAAIKKAYKAAALKWHPDSNPDNCQEAADMFKDIQEAFNVLADPHLRRDYDNLGEDKTKSSRAYSSADESCSDTPLSRREGPYKPMLGAIRTPVNSGGYSNSTSSGPALGPSAANPVAPTRHGKFGLGKGGGSAATRDLLRRLDL